MRRRYRDVAVEALDSGWGVRLDALPLKTPAGAALSLPRQLAEAVAAEWRGQGDTVKPETMPMMRLAATALDRIAPQRDAVVKATAAYGASDLLCYRADGPADLIERQRASWQPLLDWAALRFDAPLRISTGIMPAGQPADSLQALERTVATFDLLTLTALADLTGLAGSLIVALALWDGRIDAATAADIVLLDEAFQAERWGEDAEAVVRQEGIIAEIATIARFFALLAP
jgi:chaperone required for assembly of F1-ATPase